MMAAGVSKVFTLSPASSLTTTLHARVGLPRVQPCSAKLGSSGRGPIIKKDGDSFQRVAGLWVQPVDHQGAGAIGASTSGAGSMSDLPERLGGSPLLDGTTQWQNFCIIEGRDTVQDFAKMEMTEILENVAVRRNRIFLLMEEVRRLRIQQRIKAQELGLTEVDDKRDEYPSSIPFLPPLTEANLQQYYVVWASLVAAIITFGGLFAPILELKLGLGGTSYEDFIRSMHLPLQLSQVDPIVASFSGGAVGVLSALLVVEVNNVKQQDSKRCKYCCGSGYLACGLCSGGGANVKEVSLDTVAATAIAVPEGAPATAPVMVRCSQCAGVGKVMCPTCLCTGMLLATEHDPRIDPFD